MLSSVAEQHYELYYRFWTAAALVEHLDSANSLLLLLFLLIGLQALLLSGCVYTYN